MRFISSHQISQSLVSVIIPVYNGASFLGEAIESAINQTYSPYEIIVVDDGSTDNTREVAQKYPIRYFLRPHQGASAARNFGIAQSQGNLLAFLDADDIWLCSKLEKQIQILNEQNQLDAVFGMFEQFGSNEIDKTEPKARFVGEILKGIHLSTMLIRRSSFLKVGWFDPRWVTVHFVDWYIRALQCGLNVTILEEILMRRRVHRSNLTLQMKELYKLEALQVLKAKVTQDRLYEDF